MRFADLFEVVEPQALLDRAVHGLMRQGNTSRLYLNKKTGDRCPLGHCMSQRGLEYLLERGLIRTPLYLIREENFEESRDSLASLMEAIQDANDEAMSWLKFRERIINVAMNWQLDTTSTHALTDEWCNRYWFTPARK